MRLFYNIIQLLLAPLLILFFLFTYILNRERRKNLIDRTGYKLKLRQQSDKNNPIIWIHALSVGEITSALPLIEEIRHQEPEIAIVFSTTTTSGRKLAEKKIRPLVDHLVPFPLDILFVVQRFIDIIDPDLFILVETDFWPNLLGCLRSRDIPLLLVNGRISEKSMNKYLRFRFFFRPMFEQFNELCMQTSNDVRQLKTLGLDPDKLKTWGNLKYRMPSIGPNMVSQPVIISAPKLFILCGSTHPGEEEIIFSIYSELRTKHQMLNLAVAPRQPKRAEAICRLADKYGFSVCRFSCQPDQLADILIIDTIGDLADLYSQADIAFIGGSLVPEGGHNPLESTIMGVPTLFGPFVDDFQEICGALVGSGSALQITDRNSLYRELDKLISSEQYRNKLSENALNHMNKYRNVLPAHIEMIRKYL